MAVSLPFSLTITSLIVIFSALFVVTTAVSYVRSFLRLRHIPGPKLYAWTGLPLLWDHLAGHLDDDLGALAEEYGPLVRLGPNHLITADPEQWRAMNAPRSPFRRSDYFQALRLHPGRDNVLSYRNEQKHDELRRKMAAGYSGKENPGLEESIDNRLRDFFDLIDRNYLSDKDHYRPMDLAQKVEFFTLDVISDIAFDSSFGDLRDDNDNFHYLKDMVANIPVMIALCVLPKVHAFMERSMIMQLMAPSAKDRTGLGRVISVAVDTVNNRFDADGKLKDRNDMLGSFLRHGLTREEAQSETVLQIIAGSDTTATALRSSLLHIISNPQIHRRFMAEIAEAEKSGLVPPASTHEIISDENAKKLPYLQACIKEALRIRPPVTGMLSKEVPAGGAEVCGYFVPGGTRLGYCAVGIHRNNTAVFGADAKIFRPERWLLQSQGGTCESPQQLARMERNNELVFGSGRFQCLGKNVAFIELNKVALELLRRYDFSVCNTLQPWKSYCAGLLIHSDFWVRVERREVKEVV